MLKRSWSATSLALLVALVAAACGPAGGAAKAYRVGIFEDPTSNNIWQANGPDNTVWNAYVLLPQRLALYGLSDVRNQLIPQLAADWASPLKQEGEFWVSTVPIKKGIKWSDGTELTARDVAFTTNTILRFGLISGNWQTWADANFLARAEVVDDYTVKFVYHTKPGMARHEWGTLGAPIVCEHFWKPLVDEAAKPIEGQTPPIDEAKLTEAQAKLFAIAPNGEPLAGAFWFTKWEKGAYLENAANKDFYAKGATVIEYENGAYVERKANVYEFKAYGEPTGNKSLEYTQGPNISAAVYSIYGDQNAALLALKNGEIDFVLNPLGLQRGLLSQIEEDANLSLIQNPSNGFRYLSFNTRRKPMDEVNFRQAVATLIDKEFVTKTILQGVAYPLYTFVPKANGAYYFDGVPKFGLKDDGTPMTREERITEAVRILKAAGYKWEGGIEPKWNADNRAVDPGGRLIMPDGKPVPELELLAPSAGYDPLRSTFAIWIETWLKEAGIPVKANLTGFNLIVQRAFAEQDFDLYILGWSLSIFPSYVRDFWHSEQAVLDGNNAGGYNNPKFDTLANQLLTCTSEAECKQISDEVQKLLATELPTIVLFDTGIYEAYRSAAVEYPYTQTLAGLQSVYGLPAAVRAK